MTEEIDIVIREGYLQSKDHIVDIGIDDGTIVKIAKNIDGSIGEKEIYANGNLVSTGFVDSHKHINRAFAAMGDRKPIGADDGYTTRQMSRLFQEHYEQSSLKEISEHAIHNIEMAVCAGTTHIRSHVEVDEPIGTKTMEACIEAKKQTKHLIDLQLVPYAGEGILNGNTQQKIREAIEMGLETFSDPNSVLLGGTDVPETKHIEKSIDTLFTIAKDYDIDIDIHVSNRGTLGQHTIETLVEKTREYNYIDRVTISHCFAFAQASDRWLDEVISDFNELGINIITCYNSIRSNMPVKEIVGGGVTLGHGTDNDRDFVVTHGNADSLEAAQIMSLKLHGENRFDEDYRWYETNSGLQLLWEMLTIQGSEILEIEDYGLYEGADADILVLDKPSIQWSIIEQANRSYVIKDGSLIVEDGELLPEKQGQRQNFSI